MRLTETLRDLRDLMRGAPRLVLARARARAALRWARRPIWVDTPHGQVGFAGMGPQSVRRAVTLLHKEPGTIRWIDGMRPDEVLWDVGANIGVYSLYAARRGLGVVAVEPAAVNYWLLCANIELNRLCGRITPLPFALAASQGLEDLLMSQFRPAASGGIGKRKRGVPEHARQPAPVVSGSTLLELGAAFPNHIKIDVVGVTREVLEGLRPLLPDERLRSLQVEVGNAPTKRREYAELLAPHGLIPLPERAQTIGRKTTNWIYARSPAPSLSGEAPPGA